MKKDPRVYLVHILECSGKIERYITGGENRIGAATATGRAYR